MAKRFTDTEKWKKPFIRGLEAPYKLLWLYIIDDCDHAGIWQVDIEVAEIRIGEKIDKEKAIKSFADRIHIFNDGEKWFIPNFIEFQYGELNPQNRAHNSVIQKLSKYNIKPLISPLQGAMDMDMDKDKDKEKEKEVKKTIEIIKPDWAKDFKNYNKEIQYPFEFPEFAQAWDLWFDYRKEKRLSRYKKIGEQSALIDLSNLSSGDMETAIKIINQSISKNWQGLFELKSNGKKSTKEKFDTIDAITRRIYGDQGCDPVIND